MKSGDKIWKKKLKAIDNEFSKNRLKEEVEKLDKKDLPAVILGLYGPGFVYTQIAIRNFLKVKAKSIGNSIVHEKLDIKIRSLWKILIVSASFWVFAAFAICFYILKIIARN